MFHLVPFARARREVTHGHRQPGLVGQLLQSHLPKTQPIPIASAAVGRDQKSCRLRIQDATFHAPPPSNRCHGKSPGVMVGSHIDEARVAPDVVDAIRIGTRDIRAGKIVTVHLERILRATPLSPRIDVIANQFLLFRVHGNHRSSLAQRRFDLLIDVAELGVAIRMLGAFFRLAVALETVILIMQQLTHFDGTDRMLFPRQFPSQRLRTLTNPPQGRFRIAPRSRFNQPIQRRQQLRIAIRDTLASGPSLPYPSLGKRDALGNLPKTLGDRHARQSARTLHRAHPAISQRLRLVGCYEPARPLIEQRPYAAKLVPESAVRDLHTRTIESPTVPVKFIYERRLNPGGTLNVNGAILTHVADDTVGGDTNMDGPQTQPESERWQITGGGQINIEGATEERWQTPTVISGTLAGTQTWRGNRVYFVSGDTTVASGATLTIQTGAIVKFVIGTSLIVSSGGTLNTVGNRAQPIVFTSAKDDAHGGDTNGDGGTTQPQPGDWVAVRNNGGMVRLEYATVKYGGYGQYSNLGDGTIRVQSGTTTLRGCTVIGSNLRLLSAQGGTLYAENCVLRDGRWGIDGYGAATFVNGVIDDCQTGVNGGTVVNTVIQDCIMGRSGGTLRYCCQWNSGGTLSGPGNMTADPRFVDAANGDFQLLAGSPLIDAGDGTVTPTLDYFGQPRMDVRNVPDTGVASADAVCPDIGIHEMPGFSNVNPLDLAVTAVQAPTQTLVGSTIFIQWQVGNVSGVSAGGAWRDVVSLVSEDGLISVELGTTVSSAMLASGATSTFGASFLVPPSAEGMWRVRVQVNAYRDVYEGTLISNNVLAATATTRVSVPAGDPAAGVSGTVQNGKPYATSVTFDGTRSMVGRIQAPAGTAVYYGIGFMPGETVYSGRAVCDRDGGMIGLPATDTRIYILVVSDSATAQLFTLTFEPGGTAIKSVAPNTIPRTGRTSLTLTGANFAQGLYGLVRERRTDNSCGQTSSWLRQKY